MSETDPGFSERHAGDVGSRRARVGTPTDPESINVPQTRPGAAENAREFEAAREEHETFVPEPPVPDEQSETETTRWARGEDSEEGTGDVRKDIEKTRRELGDTVSALAAKADVKGRATHAAERARERATEAAGALKCAVKDRTSDMVDKVRTGTPHLVKEAAAGARKRPVVLIVVAGAVTVFVVRRMMRCRRSAR